jgi:hypothetical protein
MRAGGLHPTAHRTRGGDPGLFADHGNPLERGRAVHRAGVLFDDVEPELLRPSRRSPVDVLAEQLEGLRAPARPRVARPDRRPVHRQRIGQRVWRDPGLVVVERRLLLRRPRDDLGVGSPAGVLRADRSRQSEQSRGGDSETRYQLRSS